TPTASTEVIGEAPPGDPSRPAAVAGAPPPEQQTRPRRRYTLVAAGVAVVVAATASTTTYLKLSGDHGTPKALGANSIGEIGSDGQVRSSIPVGTDPVGMVYAGGALWVANRTDKNVSRVNPRTGEVTQTVPVGTTPESLTATPSDLWVANRGDGTVS